MSFKNLILLFSFQFVLLNSAHGSPNIKSLTSGPIRIRVNSDGRAPFDPATVGFAHLTFYNAVLGRMLQLNQNLTTQPGLLSSAEWDYKNHQYVLKIREGLKFHNGRSVQAEDIDFSIIRFFLTTKRADPVAHLKNISGTEKLVRGSTYQPWMTSGLRKIDSRTVAIKLNHPNPAFLYSLASSWASIVPREELKDDFVTWKRFPIGAGAYKVITSNPTSTKLRQYPDHSADGPEEIEFVSTQSQEADIVGFQSPGPLDTKLEKIYGDGPIGFTGIFFNGQNDLARNKHFRAAISFAIQRSKFSAIDSDFSKLTEILPSNFYGRLNKVEKFDLSAAKLEMSKVPTNIIPKTIKAHWFTARTKLSRSDQEIIENVKSQLAAINVNVVFGPSENPTFAEADSETVLRVDDRGTAFPDPLVLFQAYEKPGFLSPFFVGDLDAYHKLINRAAEAVSIDVKAAATNDLSKYFDDNFIVVPLVERKTVYWINPSKIQSLSLQTGITFNIEKVKTFKSAVE